MTLQDLFTESLAGKGRVVIVSGPVATGKSELLHTFGEAVVRCGALFLCATASRTEQALPLGVLGQLFRNAALPPDRAARVSDLLGGGAFNAIPNESEPDAENSFDGIGPGDAISTHVVHTLSLALLDVVRRTGRPLVIGIDDVHYVDVPSLYCLSFLIRRLRCAKALIVLNESILPRPAHPVFRAELPPEPRSRRIQLRRLSASGVEAVLARHLDLPAAKHLAPECSVISGGNALLVRGLADDYLAAATQGAPRLTVGASFSQALLGCLRRCEPSMLKVARGAAVLAEQATPMLLGALLDLEAGSVTRALDALNANELLDSGQFRHANARATVLDDMGQEERAALHARAAWLLHREGSPESAVANQLLAAEGADGAWVVPVLQEAAKQALTEGARELALRYLRLAHRADVGNAQRATTTAMLARAEWRGNPSTALRHATELIEAAREGLLTGRDAVASIHHLLWFGQVDLAVRALRDVERTVSQTDPVTAAHVQNTWLWLAHTYPAYRGHLRMDVVPATVSSHLQAATTLRSVLMRGCDSDLVADAEQILKECLLDEWMLAPAGAAVFALIYGDQLSTATMWCELLAGQAQAHNAPTWHAFFSALRAEIALRQGDLPMAEAYARTALTIVSPKGWGVAIGLPLSTLLQASTAMGNYEDAVNHLRVPVPDAIFQTVTGLHYLRARGLYHQAVGRLHAAAADFQAVGDLMVAWGMDFPALIPWRTDVAQVFLETSRVRQARELAAEQLRRVDPTQLRARGISMRVLAIGANPSQRLALLGQAVEALQETEDRRELARALTELDKAHQARGKTDQARPIVGRAKQGNQSGVGDARRAAPLELMTRRPKGHLTGAEQRVATLAGQGLTNRQIADRLYITVSTVEQHLTSAYRKLKLSRADLRRRLRSDQPMKPDRGSAAEGPPRDHTAM